MTSGSTAHGSSTCVLPALPRRKAAIVRDGNTTYVFDTYMAVKAEAAPARKKRIVSDIKGLKSRVDRYSSQATKYDPLRKNLIDIVDVTN